MARLPTIHYIYPHGDSISCPHAIGTKLATILRRRFSVIHYDLSHPRVIVPAPGDILLGHPDSCLLTVFRSSLRHPGWSRRIMMVPYTHGDYRQCAYLDRIIGDCDLFLAITGSYWFESIHDSRFAHWLPKMRHLDLAVDTHDFPTIKTSFNPPGQRRFAYIGHAGWYKNLAYLAEIARSQPEVHFGWFGDAVRPYPGLQPQGVKDFRTSEARQQLAEYDFLITVGTADPNPTTILEAMAWGLVPVCTPQSGYHREGGIINVPLDDVPAAAAVVRRLQDMPEDELLAMQAHNRQRLREHYHWERFGEVVLAAITALESPRLATQRIANRLALWREEIRAPHSFLRYQHLRRAVLRRWFGRQRPHPCAAPEHCADAPTPVAVASATSLP